MTYVMFNVNTKQYFHPMRKTVIVDIDGTVSKVGDRLKYLKQKPVDWDSFYEACFEDEPIAEIVNLVRVLDVEYHIVFCTGRRESTRGVTRAWIRRFMPELRVDGGHLLMRPDGDYRHDTIVKPEQLEKAGINLADVAFVLEDRDSMVAKWRELGVKCLQVAKGDF